MGLPGVSITDSKNGKVDFLFLGDELKAFIASKVIEDNYGRIIHYVDIQGTLLTVSGTGLGKFLGRESLKSTLLSTNKDVILLARTQNPREVGVLKAMLPSGILLSPFWSSPTDELIESTNWLIKSGQISRNARPDFKFEGKTSFINWGAYGFKGDGLTWEDMTKSDPAIRWDLPNGIVMQNYAKLNGTDIKEMLHRGHAFIVGAYIKR